MIFRCILPQWARDRHPDRTRVLEGEYSQAQVEELNSLYYNIYFLPNYPSSYKTGTTVDGSHIDRFRFCFVDMDMKDGVHASKESFIELLKGFKLPPTLIVDSGNGIHAYWSISDLDAKSYLRLQRRLTRYFKTDEAVSKIYQLMRHPGSFNTKDPDNFKLCDVVYDADVIYSCEALDKALPIITREDEDYTNTHYDRTYNLNTTEIKVDEAMPVKFAKLLASNSEVKELWSAPQGDRSKADYRLGHIMFANGFTKPEAMSVLINCGKALERSLPHRVNYANNIIDKIWIFELSKSDGGGLSSSVQEILQRSPNTPGGERFPCHKYIDNTVHGFRLGQVIGLVAGSGVGKTAMALNMFEGFVQNNPNYDHFFVPLEQPAEEIAERWRQLCGDNSRLHDKVHLISNYADDGSFRHLSLSEIRDYLIEFQKKTGRKIGCVVIDHIGALKKKGQEGENQGIMDICHEMKAFAIQTNTLLVMQSQSSREKAGIGDLELNKDAAYGTVYFESYCDYLVTIWQPLKRVYEMEGCPVVTAFKFCKIRHKKVGKDALQEDACYRLIFDPESGRFKEMTQDDEKSFDYFNIEATNRRKRDRKTDVVNYTSTLGLTGDTDGKVDHSNHLP